MIWLIFINASYAGSHIETQIIDLSYTLNNKTMSWPGEQSFLLKKLSYGEEPEGYFYSAYRISMPEHSGTHIDAPCHFLKNGPTVDTISNSKLIGNAVIISVLNKTKNQSDYAITSEDIQHFEKKNRLLNEDDIVLFYTGWGKYWGDPIKYFGLTPSGTIDNLHFPGLSKDAAQYLAKRKVKGVGIDTASLDRGCSSQFEAHQIIAAANIFGIENLANLESVPSIGARLFVAPLKIKGGSGAPARVYAFIEQDTV